MRLSRNRGMPVGLIAIALALLTLSNGRGQAAEKKLLWLAVGSAELTGTADTPG